MIRHPDLLEGTTTFANFIDSSFDRCKAFSGGGISGEVVSSITANNTDFTDCEAANQGGALQASGGEITLGPWIFPNFPNIMNN